MRQDELTALTTAFTIVKSRVTAADEQGKTGRLVEETAEVSKAFTLTKIASEQEVEVSDDESDGILAAESSLQLGKPRLRLAFIAKATAELEAQQDKHVLASPCSGPGARKLEVQC